MHSPSRQRLVWAMLACFVIAQLLGILHQVAHGQSGEASGERVHAAAQVPSAAPAKSWLARLFAGHQQDSGDCRLLDQLTHADLLPTIAALALPLLPPATFVQALHGEAVARWAALFDARGPPAFR